MFQLLHKHSTLSSYTELDADIFSHAVLHFLIEKQGFQLTETLSDLRSSDTYELKISKYFGQLFILFSVLVSNSKKLQKIYELDLMNIQKIGFESYAKYMSSLDENTTVVIKDESTNFLKYVDLELLKNIDEGLPLVVEEFQNLNKRSRNKQKHLEILKILERIPSLSKKLKADLNKTSEF